MNFDEWLKSDAGKKCADYPITGGSEYLRNRLWWAFSAGEQYARDKLVIEDIRRQLPTTSGAARGD
jgi:hypothetical protein